MAEACAVAAMQSGTYPPKRARSLRLRRFPRGPVVALLVLALLATACGTSASSSSASQKSSLVTTGATGGTFRVAVAPWANVVSYNPYSSVTLAGVLNFALLPLAVSGYTSPTSNLSYYPELATRWTSTPSALTLHLRHSNWQDGTPFTAKDVATSLLLAGADSNVMWASISKVTTPNAHTVVISLRPGAISSEVLYSLSLMWVLPSSQYGHLVPRGLQQDLITYWHLYDIAHATTQTVQAASTSPAGQTIATVAKKLAEFNPRNLIGDGPFRLTKANSSEILFSKWSRWWDSRKIHAAQVEVLGISPDEQYSAIKAGRIDYENDTLFLDPEVEGLKGTQARSPYEYYPSDVTSGLIFNTKDYPFNLTGVRQALAYVINRKALAKEALAGTVAQNPPLNYLDGLNNALNRGFLSPSQRAKLVSYSYDPKKATSLLERLGFTKRAGSWYTPKGKRFTITIVAASGQLRMDQEGLTASKMLTSFGIESSVSEIELSSFTTEVEDGNFPVAIDFVLGDGGQGWPSPVSTYFTAFDTFNYPSTYSGVGKCDGCHEAIGIGPIARVPGLGRVPISAALAAEVASVRPKDWNKYTWDWARFVNQELPVVQLTDTAAHMAYSETEWRDWPSPRKLSEWDRGFEDGLVAVMQEGYLRPR